MTENEIAREIVDAAYKIHTMLGPGLLESVYEAVLASNLKNAAYMSFANTRCQLSGSQFIYKKASEPISWLATK
jgi:GxxExxY protein